jgi:hypothetical protein
MRTSIAGPTDSDLENLLRSALAARTEQITAADLATPRPLAELLAARGPEETSNSRYRHVHHLRWAVPTSILVAAAAVSVLVLGGPSRPSGTSPGTAVTATALGPIDYVVNFTGGATETQELTLSFTPHVVPIDGTKATSTYPLVVVAGGDEALNRSVTDAVNTRLTARIDRYRTQLLNLELADQTLSQEITVRADAQWGHDLSIVFDEIDDFGGAVPSNSSTAVILDKRTGGPVQAAEVFTDVPEVDKIMRKAIRVVTLPAPASREDLATLSMTPQKDGLTGPLTWYPTATGLHWVVDRGAVASDAQGQPAATVPWATLTALLSPDNRG